NAFTFNNTDNKFTGDGSGLTRLKASSIDGPLDDGLLSPNVALLNRDQTFSGNNSFGNVTVGGSLGLYPSTSQFSGLLIEADDVWPSSRSPSDWINSYFLRARRGIPNLFPPNDLIFQTLFVVRGDGHVGIGVEAAEEQLSVAGGVNIDQGNNNSGTIAN